MPGNWSILGMRRLSGNEAAVMDPQSRFLLEQTSSALADAAGSTAGPAPPNSGVYVGVMHIEFIQYLSGERPYGLLITAHSFKSLALPFCNDPQTSWPENFNTASTCKAHRYINGYGGPWQASQHSAAAVSLACVLC